MRQEMEVKQQEYERVNIKYAKAQSRFIEIMRELSRFRDEFNDHYSVRSKLQKVLGVTEAIDNVLQTKQQVLDSEEQILAKFQQMEQRLFRSDSPHQRKFQQRRRASVVTNQKTMKDTGDSLLNNHCQIMDKQQLKVMKINNVKCIVKYTLNKQKAECVVTIFTQASHESFSHTFSRITEKFQPWKEIEKLQFKTY